MDKELLKLLDYETAIQDESLAFEVSAELEMMGIREKVVSCLIRHEIVPEEMISTVCNDDLVELANKDRLIQEVSELVYAVDYLCSAVFFASYDDGRKHAIEALTGMMDCVDQIEDDPEPWIKAARELIPDTDILGLDETPLDEITQALRDMRADLELQEILLKELQDRIKRAARLAIIEASANHHDDTREALLMVRIVTAALYHGKELEAIGFEEHGERPIISGSGLTVLEVSRRALELMQEANP